MFTHPNFYSRRFFHAESASARLTIGVSDCLTGAAVRYDGASKNLAPLRRWPATQVHLLPLCPEVGAGFAVPRPPVQLVTKSSAMHSLRALGRDDPALDVTTQLETFADAATARLAREQHLCGYIWKSRSPSCGLDSTPIYNHHGEQIETGSGIQAARVRAALPWLVAIEDTTLNTDAEAARFLLLCRLVFDARWADAESGWHNPETLRDWYRHYDYVAALLPDTARTEMKQHVNAGDWPHFLRVLLHGCINAEAEQLLGLFMI